MQWLTRSDTILLCIAAYVAVTALVRMMKRRRDQVVAEVQQQVEAHRKRRQHGGTRDGKKAA
jgi:hypothetical protein